MVLVAKPSALTSQKKSKKKAENLTKKELIEIKTPLVVKKENFMKNGKKRKPETEQKLKPKYSAFDSQGLQNCQVQNMNQSEQNFFGALP